jgi:hypothetical protein
MCTWTEVGLAVLVLHIVEARHPAHTAASLLSATLRKRRRGTGAGGRARRRTWRSPWRSSDSHSRYIDGEVQLPGARRANSSSTPAETEAPALGFQKAVEAAGRGCKRLVEGISSTSSTRPDLPAPAAGRGVAIRDAASRGASRFVRLHDLGRGKEKTCGHHVAAQAHTHRRSPATTAAPPKPPRPPQLSRRTGGPGDPPRRRKEKRRKRKTARSDGQNQAGTDPNRALLAYT